MISVVMPTIWRGSCIENELPKLLECSDVFEIILINNSPQNTPSWYEQYKNNNKILEIKLSRNVYVNPAWNIGVAASSSKYVMLHQDDISFDDYHFLKDILNKLENENVLIGCDAGCFKNNENTGIVFNNINQRTYGYGCSMFFRKSSYKNIPSFYKLWKGDDCLIELFKHRLLPVLAMSGINIKGKISETIDGSKEFDFKFQEGNANFEEHLKGYLND